MPRRVAIHAALCLMLAGCAIAQTNPPNHPETSQQPAAQPGPQTGAQAAKPAATAVEPQTKPRNDAEAKPEPEPANTQTRTPLNSDKIPSGSKVYVAPMGGFENYVVAGIMKKKVPVVIVADRDKAEYEIRGSEETEKAGWAKMLFMGSQNSNEQASINITEIKSGKIVFAYSVNKLNSYKGKQSAGEAIGKHLKKAISKD